MKGLLGAVLLGTIAFAIWYGLISAGGQEKYVPIQIAYGNAKEGQVEMHTNVGVVMFAVDRKPELGKVKTADDWIADHFKLIDSNGQPVKMDRQNHSNVIKPHQVLGTQEFFLVSKLRSGEEYTCEYKPRMKEPEFYRYTFVAPAGSEKPATRNFSLVN